MSKVDLTWKCDLGYESFDIYVSNASFTSSTLPTVWATGITSLNYTIVDPPSDPCYVMIASVKGTARKYSNLFKVNLTRDTDPELNLSVQPIAFYKLNELTGNFVDTSGNNRTLVASTTVLRNLDSIDITKKPSSAALTTASDKWIGKYNGSVTLGTNITFMAWLKIPDSSVSLWGEYFKIGAVAKGFSFGFNNGGSSAATSDKAGRYILIGQNAISFRPTTYKFSNAAQNAHVAVRFTSGGVLTVFVNGVPVYNQTGVGTINTPTDVISVGYGEIQPGVYIPMSRVAVFNAALSDSEILACASITAIQRS